MKNLIALCLIGLAVLLVGDTSLSIILAGACVIGAAVVSYASRTN